MSTPFPHRSQDRRFRLRSRRRMDRETDVYRQVVSQIADYAIIRLDMDGHIETWNAGAENIKGYSEDEILGADFRTFYPASLRESGWPDQLLATAARDGRVADEGWRVRKDGTLFWASVAITALYNEAGKQVGYCKVTRDLTEQRVAEQELRASEERYQKMVAEVRDYAIILLGPDGDIRSWNAGAEGIKGYQADEIIGGDFRCFYSEKDRTDGKPDRLLAIAREEGRAADESWRVRKDGSRFLGQVTITALHGVSGEVIGFSKVTRDITERFKAEEKLRRSEERYHQMVEEVTDYAIISLDTRGIVQTWNRGAEAIKGYVADEIIGESFHCFYPAEDRANGKPDQLLMQALTGGRAHEDGWRVRKDGSRFWASVVLTALHDTRGRTIGITKVTRDLTDRKLAEDQQKRLTEQLRHRNQELNNFAYLTSHDLQEPLRSVTGFTRLLERRLSVYMDDNAREMMDFVHQATGRMSRMIQDLLEHSRLGRHADFGSVDCNALIADLRVDMAQRLQDSAAVIHADDLPTLNGGATELRLLFQNLVDNAIKFAREGHPPEITISAAREAGHWHLQFRDNGIGMPPEYSERVFNIFQRLHTREEYAGTGIGLAHCRKIAVLHGGAIWVDSVPGEGSCFHVTLDAQASELQTD